jgi:hypothetical protein
VTTLRRTARGTRARLNLLAALAIAACSSNMPAENGAGDGGTTSPNAGVQVGAFTVRVPASGTVEPVSVVGKVFDGETPQLVVWETASESGACKLLKPRVPFCAASCGGSAACVENNTCRNYPAAQDVGVVTATGIRTSSGASEFSMSPVANTYQAPVSLPTDAVREGDTIRFSAAGGAYPPFTLQAKGVGPLSLENASIPLVENQVVRLVWPAAPASIGSSIKVVLDISHHAGTKGKIECDAADIGLLEIPAGLVSQLLALGVAGFPTVVVTRQTVGSATIAPGRVDLTIASAIERAVTIPGLESCTGDAECTPPKRCQTDLTCK